MQICITPPCNRVNSLESAKLCKISIFIAINTVFICGIIEYLIGRNFVGRNFRRAKFSSPNKKFVTFARRKISPNENKVSSNKVQVNLRGKQAFQTNFDYLVGRNFVGQNFCRAKFSSLLKKFVTFARQSFNPNV